MMTRYTITSSTHLESHEEVNNNQDVYKLSTKDAEETKSPSSSSSSSELKDLTTVYELNKNFHIEINEQEDWLCIGKLPRDMGPEDFLGLVQDFGEVQQYFLVVSEKTGQSKGYGLVKFVQKSSSIEAKHVLDGQEINGHVIDCDWLKPVPTNPSSKPGSGPTQISLHSKCLYVDKLPDDYRDMGEFRRLFSKIVNPPYCQIALKNGVIQRWGLVEFDSSDDAEATLDLLDGHLINGNPIRVQFCIPGTHAIHIYLNFINNPMAAQAEKKALLEEAPSPKVYDQLNSLAQKNPWFVQSLQKIMSSVSNQDQSLLSKLIPTTREPLTLASSSPTNGGDPAQAALILLLAGRVSSSTSDQSAASFLQGILKKLESGENASQILRSILPTSSGQPASTSELIQSALNYSNETHKSSKPTKEKDPQLTDLLYRSFQAKLARGDYSQKKNSNEKRFTPPSPHLRPPMKTVSPIHPEVKPVVEFCFPTAIGPPPPPPQQQQQPPTTTSHFSDPQELQFNPGGLQLPQPPVTSTDPLHCLTQSSQQAFLTQPGMLQLGQHQMFTPAMFAATQQHGLFPLPAQLMWPAQMSMYPTASLGTSTYPQHGHTMLPSHILTADPLTAFQQLQNTSYLSRVGLKRPLVSDLELESKRLRLTAIPF